MLPTTRPSEAWRERLFRRAGWHRGVYLASEVTLGAAIAERLRPDVSYSPAAPDLGFVHRGAFALAGEIYFLANTSNVRQNVKATFRVTGLEPEWWNPLSGRIETAHVLERSSAATTVAVDLEPYGSQILVFTRPEAAPQIGRPRCASASRNRRLST